MSDNKRIAKNTLFLYMRMLLIMIVSLYTSRIVLRALGIEDFGLQNVVGGIVTLASFITGTISSATSRFFAFEIGKNDYVKLNRYFCISVLCFLFVSIIIIILAETIGLWFIYNQLVIPLNRIDAALWVYQFSILSFVLNLFVIPYQSLIIAQERMNIYAYVSIIEVILKLVIAFLITVIIYDKLKVYAVMLFTASLVSGSLYVVYCHKKYSTACKLFWYWNKNMFRELFSFSGWMIFGAFSGICRGQGLNLLLGVFFGSTVNAARGLAYQLNHAINQFATSFYTACRPQITKLYAQGNNEDMMNLIFYSSKYCFFLIFAVAYPVLLETDYILHLWLEVVPEYTVIFTKLVIIIAIIDSISFPFQSAISATGKIKYYQIVTGGSMILTLPISYFFLKLGSAPQVTMYAGIFTSILAQILRVVFMKKMLTMSLKDYFNMVIIRIFAVLVVLFPSFYIIKFFKCTHFLSFLIIVLVSFSFNLLVMFIVGLNKKEQRWIISRCKVFGKNISMFDRK